MNLTKHLTALLITANLGWAPAFAAQVEYTADIISVGVASSPATSTKQAPVAVLTSTQGAPAFSSQRFALNPKFSNQMLATLLTAVSNNQQVKVVADLESPLVVTKGQDPIAVQLWLMKNPD